MSIGRGFTRRAEGILEQLNREIKRRTDVVQVFPDEASVIRLVGAVLLEIADEWAVERHYFSQSSMQRLAGPRRTAPDLFRTA